MVRFTFDMDMSKISVAESDLLYDMLIGGYSSKFFIEMSEKRGLFYDVSGGMERYRNLGTLSFSYEVKEAKLKEAVAITVSVLNGIKSGNITEDECMKVSYVDNAMMLYDDPRELNFTFAYDNHVMNAGYDSIESRMKAYKSVDCEALTRAAGELFTRNNLTVTVKGSKKRINTSEIEDEISKL
jgi:predicted Zn-dependent peptidase